jgi:peroxiredoxin
MEQVLVISSVLLWIAVLANLLLTLVLVRRFNGMSQQEAPGSTNNKSISTVGRSAPDFTAETLTGEQVTLANYQGRPVAFILIGTGCEPCQESLPSYEALRPKAERAGVELVLVCIDDAPQTRSFVDVHHVRLPVLVAPHPANPFMKDYGTTSTPTYFMVNERGIVQSAGYPSLEWGEWKALAESWDRKTSEARIGGLAASEGG